MPAAAIAPAVIAIGFAAVETTVFTVAAAIGATMAAVGSLTGSKELQIAGTVLGAVGAVGSLATSAGLFGTEAVAGATAGGGAVDEAGFAMAFNEPAAGTASQAVTPLAGSVTPAGGEITASTTALPGVAPVEATPAVGADVAAATTPVGSTAAPDIMSEITGSLTVPEAAPPEVTATAAPDVLPTGDTAPVAPEAPSVDPGTGLINQPATADGQVIPQGDGEGGTLGSFNNPSAGGSINEPVTGTTGLETPKTPGPMDAGLAGTYDAAAAAAGKYGSVTIGTEGAGSKSIWDRITGFVEKNPMMVLGGLAAAGSFLSGATSPLTPAQVAALESQAEQNRAAANLYRTQNELQQRRLDNMRQPIPVARGATPQGLINQVA